MDNENKKANKLLQTHKITKLAFDNKENEIVKVANNWRISHIYVPRKYKNMNDVKRVYLIIEKEET